jgi:hypothetical protein
MKTRKTITAAKPGDRVYLGDGIFARKKGNGDVQYGIATRHPTVSAFGRSSGRS